MFQCVELESGPALGFDGSRKPIFTVSYPISPADLSLVFLSKGQDGSLIVNYRTARVGIERSLIGSSAGWVGGVWWRYAPVAPNRLRRPSARFAQNTGDRFGSRSAD